MASLLESFGGMVTPDAVGSVAKSLGLDPNLVSKGMGVVGPLLTTGLAKAAGSQEGLSGLMDLLPKESTDDVMGLIKGVVSTPEGQEKLDQVMNLAFGGGAGTATRSVDKALGFPASGLLVAAVPMVMNLIKKSTTSENLDANGVAKMLQDDATAFMEKGGPNADIVQGAWDNVDNLNKLKARFTEKELGAIGGAPLAAAGLVMAASPSKGSGAMKELAAAAQSIGEAEDRAGGVSLVDLLPKMSQAEFDAYMSTPSDSMLGTIKNAVAAVAAKAPEHAAGYRSFLLTLSNNVANAAKEGGFLGIGAKAVSDAEAAALAQIQAAVEG